MENEPQLDDGEGNPVLRGLARAVEDYRRLREQREAEKRHAAIRGDLQEWLGSPELPNTVGLDQETTE